MFPILMIGVATALLVCYLRSKNKHSPTYPPGPKGIPIIGIIPYLKPTVYIALTEMRKQYGEIFTVDMFGMKFVVLDSITAIKTALVDNAITFSFRPRLGSFETIKNQKGIMFGDGDEWRDRRRFALKTLRNFGFARALSVDAIHTELESLMKLIQNEEGKPLSTRTPLSTATTNVVSRLIFCRRLGEEKANCDDLIQKLYFFMKTATSIRHDLLNAFPFLAKIPFFAKLYQKMNYRSRCSTDILNFIHKNVQERLKKIGLKDGVEPQDLLDAIILHKIALDSESTDHPFDEESIVMTIFDLLIAGSDTTSVTLTWAMLLMSVYPEVQKKTRAEIREHIGYKSLPTMQDKPKLSYTLAVIDEINRFSSISPFALMHRTSEDVTICGKQIPKDTSILPNIYAVHHDPALWKYPYDFNPENFLDESGVYKASENLITFSIGKRACLGESLARMEIFIFFCGLMQKYWVSLANQESTDLKKLLMGADGFIRYATDHELQFHDDPVANV